MPGFATAAPSALFDDNLGTGCALHLTRCIDTFRCTAPAQIDATFAAIEAARAAGHWVAIAAAYELGYALEPCLAALRPHTPTPLLQAWVFADASCLDAAGCAHLLGPESTPAGLLDLHPAISRADYLAAVRQVQAHIAEGDCYQANFTFPYRGRAYGTPGALYRLLRAAQPVRYGALIEHADGCLLSRSPELFVERRGNTLTCKPMKGTAPADAAPTALTDSAKNRAENVMIVDLIRNDLGRLAPPGGVRVPRLFEAERFSSVWQMTSTVTASPIDAGLREIFAALFPCGSVTGAPKIRAMQIIHALEATPRGVYCGALGWLAPDGDFCFNVPIRTLEIAADGAFRYGAGSGIVHDSSPDGEWDECRLKAQFLHTLPSALELFETLHCDGGAAAPYRWLDDHLARLRTSARAFGFACDEAAIRQRLASIAATLNGPHRVRLALSADGAIALSLAPLDALPAMPTVTLADTPLDPGDPLLRHKSTARARYDAALRVAVAAGHFDTLFFNTRGELAEGCRSNVFVERGGRLLTPPESAGLLNGICRRRLLREGRAIETTLTRADVLAADALYVSNALRGLVEVRLIS